VSDYVAKVMEFVETFLVANRLTKELRLEGVWPLNFTPTECVAAILDVVGRGTGEKRMVKDLRYYPAPHLQFEVNTPFIDFAGFLMVLLQDYLRWSPVKGDKIAAAARLEIDSAIEFLADPDTYIADSTGVGWAFVPKSACNQNHGELRLHRHILPTAWAVTAIQRFLAMPDADATLKTQAAALLPKVLSWVGALRTDSGLFLNSERKEQQPNLAGHNYVTEVLLTLAEREVSGADKLAITAVDRFLDALDQPNTRDQFEMYIVYPVFLTRGLVRYNDHTTWATCLATLAFGVSLLKDQLAQDGGSERLSRARTHCNDMAKHILDERRNERMVWQKGYFQFHWTLTAVEALLRTARYAQRENLSISTDGIVQAVHVLLEDSRFQGALRTALLAAIRKTASVPGPLQEFSGNAGDHKG
jgi:hypothetical protein